MAAATETRSFIERFEAGEVDAGGFHHRDHVELAWRYLELYPPLAAIDRFCGALQRFAAAAGKPELYHETITWAYLLLIRQRREELGSGHSWESFAAANPDLLAWPGSLQQYYRPDTLGSPRARRFFVLPDAALDPDRRSAPTGEEG